jgi:hypothetical protein
MMYRSESYHEKAQELVTNENTLLQTLGFDVAIDHPHTHVVRCCQLVKASKELAQASYYLATNSLHLTPMCLRYTPTIVACFCIHLACKWSNYKIPLSAQNKEWYVYVDPAATHEILEELTEEFLTVYDQCPSRLKKKIKASTQAVSLDKPYWCWRGPRFWSHFFNAFSVALKWLLTLLLSYFLLQIYFSFLGLFKMLDLKRCFYLIGLYDLVIWA